MGHRSGLWVGAVAAWLAGCVRAPPVIDNAALSGERDGANWPAYGRTFSEGHFSPLTQITA
jgi:quinohemoprotein ethanol dehydrogenase